MLDIVSKVLRYANAQIDDSVTYTDFEFTKEQKQILNELKTCSESEKENLATIKSEKKKKMLAIPVIETYMEKVFAMTDYDVFFNLELNDYFVFEQKESLIDSENEGREK